MTIAVGAVVALSFFALRASLAGPEDPQADEGRELASTTPTATVGTSEASAVPSTPTATEERITQITPVATDTGVGDALDGGEITFEEYTEAVFNTMACLDEKGIEHTEPVYDESQAQYTYSVTNPEGTDPREVSAYDECWMKYERDIQSAWVQQNGAKRIQEVEVVNEEGALQCAAEFGLEASSFDDIRALKIEHPQDPAIQSCFITGTLGYDPSR